MCLKYRIYTRSAKDNDAESDLNLEKSRDADNETDTSWQQGCEGEKIDCLRKKSTWRLAFELCSASSRGKNWGKNKQRKENQLLWRLCSIDGLMEK